MGFNFVLSIKKDDSEELTELVAPSSSLSKIHQNELEFLELGKDQAGETDHRYKQNDA